MKKVIDMTKKTRFQQLEEFIEKMLQEDIEHIFVKTVKAFPEIVSGDWAPDQEMALDRARSAIKQIMLGWAENNLGAPKGSLEELRIERNLWLRRACRRMSEDGFEWQENGKWYWIINPYETPEEEPCFPEDYYGQSYIGWRDIKGEAEKVLMKSIREYEIEREQLRARSKG